MGSDAPPGRYEEPKGFSVSLQLKDPAAAAGASQVEKVNPFLPDVPFLAPIDSKFGPDGALWVALEAGFVMRLPTA